MFHVRNVRSLREKGWFVKNQVSLNATRLVALRMARNRETKSSAKNYAAKESESFRCNLALRFNFPELCARWKTCAYLKSSFYSDDPFRYFGRNNVAKRKNTRDITLFH